MLSYFIIEIALRWHRRTSSTISSIRAREMTGKMMMRRREVRKGFRNGRLGVFGGYGAMFQREEIGVAILCIVAVVQSCFIITYHLHQ